MPTAEVPQLDIPVAEPIQEVQPAIEPVVEQPVEVEQSEIPTAEVPQLDIPVIEPVQEAQPTVEETTDSEQVSNIENDEGTDTTITNEVVQDIVPDIYANTDLEEKLIKKDATQNETDELLKNSKDGITLDYNKLYNVNSSESNINNTTNNSEELSDNSKSEDVINSLSVAAPPSFEVVEKNDNADVQNQEIEENTVEQQIDENLISIDIDEPNALPVGFVKRKEEVNNVNENTNNIVQTPIANVQQNQNANSHNQAIRPTVIRNNPPINYQQQNRPVVRNNQPYGNARPTPRPSGNSKFIRNDNEKYTLPKQERAVVNQPTDPNLIANPLSIFGGSSNGVLRPTSSEAMRNGNSAQRNMGPRVPQQRPQQGPMGPRMPQQRPQQGPMGPRMPQQRPQQGPMGPRMPQQRPQQGPMGPRMPQQRPQQRPHGPQQRPAGGRSVCPHCGLPVKPGQPICLMCGEDIRW